MTIVANLNQLQVAKETTWGTAVTPMTRKIQGITDFTISPGVETEVFAHRRGSMVKTYNVDFNKMKPSAKASIDVSYEDINYWLESLTGEATPTGAGPYVRTGSAPISAAPNARKMTMTWGQTGNIYQMNGGLVKALTFKGESTGKVTADVELIGSRVVNTGALAALSDIAQNYVMGLDVALYIDAIGGTIGTTSVPTTAMSFTLKIDTGRDSLHYFGSNYPTSYKDPAWTGSLDMHMEMNATTKAYLDAMIGLSSVPSHQIRLQFTRGTNILQLNFAGALNASPDIYTVDNDILSLDFTWNQLYSSALTNWFTYSSTSGLATLA